MKQIVKTMLAALALAMVAMPAQAFIIKNHSGEPYTLTFKQLGSVHEIEIPAGGRYQRMGVGVEILREGMTPIIVRPDAEYTIWPNGKIHLQRYRKIQFSND